MLQFRQRPGCTAYLIFIAFALLIVLLSVPAWLSGQSNESKPALLFIIDGQSNAGSTGNGELIGPEWQGSEPEVMFYSPQYLNHKNWVPLKPHPYRKPDFGIDSLGFGVELSLAKLLKETFPDHVIAVARRSSGGTSIIAWDKDWRRPGWEAEMARVENKDKPPQYPRLLSLVEEATAALLQEPSVSEVELGGFVWIQGERDSRYQFAAERYEANLTALIANVREDLNAPDLPFMFGEAHTHPDAYMEVVDQAVRNVDRDVPDTGLVLTKDLPTHDGIHYDTEGTLELGRRFAAVFLELYIAHDPLWTPAPTRTPSPTPLPTDTPTPTFTPTATATPSITPPPTATTIVTTSTPLATTSLTVTAAPTPIVTSTATTLPMLPHKNHLPMIVNYPQSTSLKSPVSSLLRPP